MRVLISGGGTGGHLISGVALYQEFISKGREVNYVLRKDDMVFTAASLISEKDRIFVSLGRVSRKLSLKSPVQVWNIFQAWRSAFKTIKAFNPDAVIITGGYVSNIAALSSFLLRKPLFILEQNSVAGITNRFWAPYASKTFTFFPEVKKIPLNKNIHAGNPMLFKEKPKKEEALAFLGLDITKPVLGVLGGSQGAKIINDLIYDLLPEFSLRGMQLVWSLGTKEYQRFLDEKKTFEAFPNVKAFCFIDRMDYFWASTDAVIARSGAGTIAESLFFQTPAIFVPIHQSPDNHQYLNASYLTSQNMGIMLEEPNFNKETLLNALDTLLQHNSIFRAKFPHQLLMPAPIIREAVEGCLKA